MLLGFVVGRRKLDLEQGFRFGTSHPHGHDPPCRTNPQRLVVDCREDFFMEFTVGNAAIGVPDSN